MDLTELLSLIALTTSLVALLQFYKINSRIEALFQAISSKVILKVLRSRRLRKKLRKRYMVFEVISDGTPDKSSLESEIKGVFKNLFGEIHLTAASLAIQYYDSRLRMGILKFTHRYRYKVLAALGLVKRVGSVKVLIVPVRTTGTYKKALKYINERYSVEVKPS